MRIYVGNSSAETQLDLRCMPISLFLEDHCFDTLPMTVVQTSYEQDEEALHSSFEDAISERVERVSRKRIAITEHNVLIPRYRAVRLTGTMLDRLAEVSLFAWSKDFWLTQRRRALLTCIGFNLMMIGFDAMGLLILRLR